MRKRALTAMVLVVTLVFLNFSAYAAWDGYIEEPTDEQVQISLLDFNALDKVTDTGGVPEMGPTINGNTYSILWSDMGTNTRLNFNDIPKDWTDFMYVVLWAYSNGAVGNQFAVIVDTGRDSSNTWRYRYSIQTVEKEGWQKLKIPITGMSSVNGPDLTKITQVSLRSSGWNMNPNGCTGSVYIGDMYVSTGDDNTLEILYTDEQIEEAKAALAGGAAIYGGSPNVVITGGEIEQLDENDISVCAYKNGDTVMAPLSFFADYMGATVRETESSCIVKLGDTEVTEEAATVINGITYLPAAETARMLGWYAVEDRALVAVSPNEAVLALERPSGVNELSEIIAYLAAYIKVKTSSVTAEDCKVIKDKWRYELVGSEADNDLTNPQIAVKIEDVRADGQSAWDSMEKPRSETKLFSLDKATSSGDMTSTASRLYNMALAYGTYGCKLYHNPDLKEDILYGLEWFYQHRYGQAEIDGNGWRSTSAYNWWDWQIGTPKNLIPVLLIMENEPELTQEMINNYLALFDKLVPNANRTGSNLMNTARLAIGSALLKNDVKKVIRNQQLVEKTYCYADNGRESGSAPFGQPDKVRGNGFYTDGSYVFHILHPMNGQYGREQFQLLGPILSMFAGTALEVTTPQADNLVEWIYNAFDPLVYQGTMFRMVNGRYPISTRSSGLGVLGAMLDALDCLDPEDQVKVKAIIKAQVRDDTKRNYYTSLSLSQAIHLSQIMADETIEPRVALITNHVYYNQDEVVHHRGNFAFALSMSSSRMFNYESINNCNLTGWYVSDGMTEYWVKGDANQMSTAYWGNINPYRLPGTTVDTQEREAVSIAQSNAYLSSQDFVGAVSLNETYGTAAMQLESYHNASDFGNDNGEYGGPAPKHDSNLMAKKAWFMFDDEVVALGTDVNASNDAEVLTVVDNKLASTTKHVSDRQASVAYEIKGVSASDTPEEENIAEHTLDGNYSTRWASESGATITWDLGEERELGFVMLAFLNGSKRTQKFTLETSADGIGWTETFSGSSSGTTDMEEAYTLNNTTGRYVRFTNLGNSTSAWVSLSEAAVYPPNSDGTVGVATADIIGADTFIADGTKLELTAGDTNLTGTKWAHFENVGGYYFPSGGNLFARYTNQASSFMEFWFSHGVNPEEGSYAYTLLPGKTPEETAAYASNPDIEVLSNTPELQVVREKKLNMTGMVFWTAGSYGGITVDQPMIVMVQENTDGSYTVAASDPTQKLTEAKITIDRVMKAAEQDVKASVNNGESNTVIGLNLTNSCGRSMEVSFIP